MPAYSDLHADTFRVAETVVTATRYPVPSAAVSSPHTVLHAEYLRSLPARNLIEALNYQPGFTVRRTGGLGTRELISIQGSEHRHVTVLFDGVPLNNLTEGLADLVQLPAGLASRVELVTGPTSSAWGSALGGVMQVLTPDPYSVSRPVIAARVNAGEWSSQQGHAMVLGNRRQLGYMLAFGQSTTDGFRPYSAHDGSDLYGKLRWRTDARGTVSLSVAHFTGETEDFLLDGQPAWKRHSYRTTLARVGYDGRFGGLDTQLLAFAIDRTDDVEFLSTQDDILSAAAFDEPTIGASAVATSAQWLPGSVSVGVDLRRTQADFQFQGGPDDRSFDESGLFLQWHHQVSRVHLNGGARVDRHSLYGSQASPSAGVVVELPEVRSRLRAHVARGFGAPPLSAAFLPATARTAPNPDLEAEHGVGVSVGLTSSPLPSLTTQLSVYRNTTDNAIESTVTSEGQFMRRNLGEHVRRGVEATFHWTPVDGMSARGGLAINRSRSESADAIISGTPRQTRDLVVTYRSPRIATLTLAGHYADYRIDPVLRNPPNSLSDNDAKTLWDLALERDVGSVAGVRLNASLQVRNLTDAEFWWLTPFPLPGRSTHLQIAAALAD